MGGGGAAGAVFLQPPVPMTTATPAKARPSLTKDLLPRGDGVEGSPTSFNGSDLIESSKLSSNLRAGVEEAFFSSDLRHARSLVELAKRLGLAVITGVCRPLDDGRYEAHLFEAIEPKPEDDTREVTQRIWDLFEAEIRKHPECWLWMYKQWRYRPVGELSVPHPDYPHYSNLSEALIQMIPEALRPQK